MHHYHSRINLNGKKEYMGKKHKKQSNKEISKWISVRLD